MSRRALISVTDKRGVEKFAARLIELGYSILSTGGTHEALTRAGVAVEQISSYTGFPEILGGRVKTLHAAVHGGILAQRGDESARAVMDEHGIDPIDVVAVNLYRFREAAARPGASAEDIIENIDIGGPAMIRSAAKNHADVTVVVDPDDYDAVVELLASTDDAVRLAGRRRLAAKAFAHTADYDTAVAGWFAAAQDGGELGERLVVAGERVQRLRYGENPHQRAAFYRVPGLGGLAGAAQLAGKELWYNNIVDLDAALALVAEFERPACAIIKHTNPCGCAVADDAPGAFRAALAADPMSAFGGIVALNRDLDEATAQAIAGADLFFEAIVAPRIDAAAVAVLAGARGGKNLRLLSLGGAVTPPGDPVVRCVHGGFLAQTPDTPGAGPPPMKTVTRRAPTDRELELLAFAWKVCKHVKSNAIVLAMPAEEPMGALSTAGVGAGQMSRVDSVRIAVEKAGDRAKGAVLASDAFFPFPDGLEHAAHAGVTAAIQPGGSRQDEAVIAAADAAGMAMVLTGIRHFRH